MDNEVVNRFVRSLIQLIAAGGATALFETLTGAVPLQYQALVAAIFYMVIVLAQNAAEEMGIIPKLLKPEPINVELVLEPKDDVRVL
jgi:hypothetical protein